MAVKRKTNFEDGDAPENDQLNQNLMNEFHQNSPIHKRLRLQISSGNIVKQTPKPNGGVWLRSDTSRQTTTILALPPELMQNIFSRLSREELSAASAVCKRWLALIKNPRFYSCITIRQNRKAPTEFFCQVLRSARWLKNLQILEREDLGPFLRVIAKHNPLVETLTISNFIPSKDHHYLNSGACFSRIQHCTNLKVLSLTNVTIRNGKHTEAMLSNLVNLKNLELYNCNLGKDFLDIFESSQIQLEEFVFRNIFSTFVPYDRSFKRFFERMALSLKVIKLSIPQTNSAIVESIACCENLIFLEIQMHYKNLKDRAIEALGNLQQLRFLNMFEVKNIRSSVWCNLLSKPWFSQLKSLGLSFCSIVDDDVLETVGSNLKDLESISLNCCYVTEYGLQQLIKNCVKLKSLTLSHASARIIRNFVLIPDYLPNLQVLSYRPTGFYNEHLLMEQIKSMTPGLKINYIYEHADFL